MIKSKHLIIIVIILLLLYGFLNFQNFKQEKYLNAVLCVEICPNKMTIVYRNNSRKIIENYSYDDAKKFIESDNVRWIYHGDKKPETAFSDDSSYLNVDKNYTNFDIILKQLDGDKINFYDGYCEIINEKYNKKYYLPYSN